MSAIEERGEAALELDGVTYVLRPSYAAIAAFEAATGKGLVQLAGEASAMRLTATETAQIACELIRAGGEESGDTGARNATATKIATLLLESEGGLVARMRDVAQLLLLAVSGGYDGAGKPKPATTTSTKDAAAAG